MCLIGQLCRPRGLAPFILMVSPPQRYGRTRRGHRARGFQVRRQETHVDSKCQHRYECSQKVPYGAGVGLQHPSSSLLTCESPTPFKLYHPSGCETPRVAKPAFRNLLYNVGVFGTQQINPICCLGGGNGGWRTGVGEGLHWWLCEC